MGRLRTVSVLLWLQKKAEDHQVLCCSLGSIVDHNGAFVATWVV